MDINNLSVTELEAFVARFSDLTGSDAASATGLARDAAGELKVSA